METLGQMYAGSSKCFPMEFLVKILEQSMMQGVSVDIAPLLYVYSRLYLAKDSICMTEGNSLHLLTVFCFPLSQFAAQRLERRQFNVVCQDTLFYSLFHFWTYLPCFYLKNKNNEIMK